MATEPPPCVRRPGRWVDERMTRGWPVPAARRSANGRVMSMNRKHVADWLAAYEQVWRTPCTDALVTLFTEDATYQQGPYWTPVAGLPAIARMWEEQRNGPDEVFQMTREIVAVDGDTAVSRQEVRYGDPVNQEYRDLWIMRFADDGRCRSFEEWPFWPGQQPAAAPDGS